MLKRTNDFFCGMPMTVVGGVFLAVSLSLMLMSVTPVVDPAWGTLIICGIPLLYLSITRVIHNKGVSKISSALLISIAMFAAIAIHDIFAAGEVAFIMAIGAILEDKTAERAKKGLRKLIDLAPVQGRRIVNGAEEMAAAEAIRVGDVLRVLPGETVPVDGEIISGSTSVDQAVITGESLPVDKTVGDTAFCGTINCFGTIDIRAAKVGENSSLQKLIRMVREAEEKKAPMQRIADRWAVYLVPVALMIAVITLAVTKDVVRAVTVLVVFCPCALVLATPTAIMAAIGQAARHGVIIKSGEALERMGKADCIAFDKTGTLTCGSLTVSDVYSAAHGLSEEQLMKFAASVEAYSEHPLAKAITAYAGEQGIRLQEAADFQMFPGKGVRAVVDRELVLCGSEKWLKGEGVSFRAGYSEAVEELHQQGKAVICTAVHNQAVGVIGLSDTLREDAPGMVEELQENQVQVVLLTGDHARTAGYFAGKVGSTSIFSELLPEQKVEKIKHLQAQGKHVCMIGDGVNDAPALKTADVGVAMGTMGSDIAVEAADIALMGDDISKIPYLKRLSNGAVRTIKCSIGLSLTINFFAILLSVSGVLTPTTGALVHNAGSILVVLLAAALYDRKFIETADKS